VVELGRLLSLDPPPAPRLWIDEAADAAAARLMPGPGPWLALGPAANWTGKEWPAECFAELAERLTGPGGALAGARVAVLAGAGEEARCRPVLDRLGARAADLAGRTDPMTAAACLRRARLFVGNDSGLMHLAAAAGTPTFGLFGPTPAAIYAPWGPRAGLVLAPDGAAAPEARMASLTVEAVLQGALALLARTGEAAAC